MTTLDWDEPYPHDVVRLRTTKHYAKHHKHLCAECWHDIEIGERYICTVYVDNGKGHTIQDTRGLPLHIQRP